MREPTKLWHPGWFGSLIFAARDLLKKDPLYALDWGFGNCDLREYLLSVSNAFYVGVELDTPYGRENVRRATRRLGAGFCVATDPMAGSYLKQSDVVFLGSVLTHMRFSMGMGLLEMIAEGSSADIVFTTFKAHGGRERLGPQSAYGGSSVKYALWTLGQHEKMVEKLKPYGRVQLEAKFTKRSTATTQRIFRLTRRSA